MIALLLFAGCDFFSDPIVPQALDYVATEPRVLGVRANPPWFVSGVPVSFDALVFGPEGAGGEATLQVCGLDTEIGARIYDVSCFADSTQVTTLGSLPGLVWTPPALHYDCEGAATRDFDTGIYGGSCETDVEFLATPDGDGRLSSFGSAVFPDESGHLADLQKLLDPIVASPPSVALTATADGNDVLLFATVTLGGLAVDGDTGRYPLASGEEFVFRWTVTEGTLAETGRTRLDAEDDGTMTSVNTWHDAHGSAAVVFSLPAFSYDEFPPLLWWATVEAP